MKHKKSWRYIIPIAGVFILAGGLYLAIFKQSPHTPSGPIRLELIGDEHIRNPMEAPDIEHDNGIMGRFHRRFGVRMNATYRPGTELLDLLYQNREGDILLADEEHMEAALEAGFVREAQTATVLVPIIMIRRDSPYDVQKLSDLLNTEIRLAVADRQSTLMGRITVELLEKNGIPYRSLDNIQLMANSAAEAALSVTTNRADATIVWRPVAVSYFQNTEIVEIPVEKNVITRLKTAVLNTSRHKERAGDFVTFVSGPAGEELFEWYDFQTAADFQ